MRIKILKYSAIKLKLLQKVKKLIWGGLQINNKIYNFKVYPQLHQLCKIEETIMIKLFSKVKN